jgi:hypothetical protein
VAGPVARAAQMGVSGSSVRLLPDAAWRGRPGTRSEEAISKAQQPRIFYRTRCDDFLFVHLALFFALGRWPTATRGAPGPAGAHGSWIPIPDRIPWVFGVGGCLGTYPTYAGNCAEGGVAEGAEVLQRDLRDCDCGGGGARS